MKKFRKAIFQDSSKKERIIKLESSELEYVTGGKDKHSSDTDAIPSNYKNRIAIAIDSVLTGTGALIGAVCGVSVSYSDTRDGNGRIINKTWKIKSPSVGAVMLYSGAGGIIGHKLANVICNKLLY